MNVLDVQLPLVKKGKVRNLYRFSDGIYLMVTTDRVSAFDHVLPTDIPGKGRILNTLSTAWFNVVEELWVSGFLPMRSHFVDPRQYLDSKRYTAFANLVHAFSPLYNRWMLVRAAEKVIPVEWIVRQYLVGSLWQSYRETGTAFGVPFQGGLSFGSPLPQLVLTPTTKAPVGVHDEPRSEGEIEREIGTDVFECCKKMALQFFRSASAACGAAGLVLVDSKFEFGFDREGSLMLIDEVCTPDSSRFWLEEDFERGIYTSFFDKEYLRHVLRNELQWCGDGPPPQLPPRVILEMLYRYETVSNRLSSVLGG
ncbi:MAG: phosphoribosylaminoimidazolesuccinocarboxamide synthase [Parcubacteria group bacterium]|nr:phosphoribosylaminoimidazolesuccinocarboxamide synthase [Parcubacteria group bacterium]